MFLDWPKSKGPSPLLLVMAISVDDDLVGARGLPMVSLLCSGLFDVGYGSTLVTLQGGNAKMKISLGIKVRCFACRVDHSKLHIDRQNDLYLSFRFSKNRARDAFRA